MIIGIMGGAFSPPTISHKAMAVDCIRRKLVDEVWVCPAYNHVDKKNLVSFDHRMAMCKKHFKGLFNHIKVCDYEKDNSSSRTYNLIVDLDSKFPKHTFKIIIGQDRADNIQEWYKWKFLIQLVPFIVFERADYVSMTDSTPWYLNAPHSFIQNNKDCWASSTSLRRLLSKQHYNLASLLTSDKVISYIQKHNLYGS